MRTTIWTQEYEVTSFLVDFQNKLALQPLLGMLQDTAWHHADHLGHGYAEVHARGVAWVLIKQKVEIEHWPDWGDILSLRTWLRPPGPVVVNRDFELRVRDRLVGRAAVHWILIDEGHRRPVPLQFPDEPGLFRPAGHLPWEPSRIAPRDGLERLAEYTVRNSELDMNLHANNTVFGRWILEALPLADLQSHVLKGYEVNFLAEAKPDERVVLWRQPAASIRRGEPVHFQGQRQSDGKVVFTARLHAERR